MQNKPNVKDAQMNISPFTTNKYEKMDTWLSWKNKPNSNPIKPCPERSRMGQFQTAGKRTKEAQRKRGYQELFCGSGLPERLTF